MEIERNPDADQDRGEDAPRRSLSDEEAAKQARARLEEIHQYLSDRQARREVVARTRTRDGLELDWVPVESQLHGAKLGTPPEEDRPVELDQGKQRAELIQFELEREDAERGPEGTVPLLRRPIDRIRPVVGLNDWLAKGVRANIVTPPDDPREIALPESGSTHKYASTSQSVTCYGTEGNINAWDPFVERPTSSRSVSSRFRAAAGPAVRRSRLATRSTATSTAIGCRICSSSTRPITTPNRVMTRAATTRMWTAGCSTRARFTRRRCRAP